MALSRTRERGTREYECGVGREYNRCLNSRLQSSTVIRHSEVLHRAAEAGSAASFDPAASLAAGVTAAAAAAVAADKRSSQVAASTAAAAGTATADAARGKGVYMLLKHNTTLHPLG